MGRVKTLFESDLALQLSDCIAASDQQSASTGSAPGLDTTEDCAWNGRFSNIGFVTVCARNSVGVKKVVSLELLVNGANYNGSSKGMDAAGAERAYTNLRQKNVVLRHV